MFDEARPFLLSLALGLLVGIERERAHAGRPGENPLGARTFTLLALLGTLAARIEEPLVAGVLAAVAGGLVLAVYLRGGAGAGGATTEVAAAATFGLGYLAASHLALTLMLGVVVVAVLALKPRIHEFAREGLAPREVNAGLAFLVLSCVVLPLLPDRPVDPWLLVNPFRLWLLFVLIAGIGFAGYIAVRALGAARGLAAAGFFAGLVSSTAATLAFSRRAAAPNAPLRTIGIAVVLANAASAAAQALVVALANPDLLADALPIVGAPVAVGALGAAGAALVGPRRAGGAAAEPESVDLGNPLELRSAALFALGLGVVLIAASAAQRALGSAGFLAIAAVAGTTDVHAVTLAAATLEGAGTIGGGEALLGIVVAFVANMGVKLALAGWAGGSRFFLVVAPPLLGMAAAAVAAFAFWGG